MPVPDYENWSRRSRQLVLLCFWGLPLVFTLSILVFPACGRQVSMATSLVIWLLHMLPLTLLVAGIMRQNTRTHVWLCFVLLGYFLLAVQNIFVCQGLLNVLELVLIVVLFNAAMLYVRWRSRALAAVKIQE
jgi:uncharacterized membrane protein